MISANRYAFLEVNMALFIQHSQRACLGSVLAKSGKGYKFLGTVSRFSKS